MHIPNSEDQYYMEGFCCANVLRFPSIQNPGMGQSENRAFGVTNRITHVNRHLNSLVLGTLC